MPVTTRSRSPARVRRAVGASPTRTKSPTPRLRKPRKSPSAEVQPPAVDAGASSDGDVVSLLFKAGFYIRFVVASIIVTTAVLLPVGSLWYLNWEYDCGCWPFPQGVVPEEAMSGTDNKVCATVCSRVFNKTWITASFILLFNVMTIGASIGVQWRAALEDGTEVDMVREQATLRKRITSNLKYSTLVTMQVFIHALWYLLNSCDKYQEPPSLLKVWNTALFSWLLVPFVYAVFLASIRIRQTIFKSCHGIARYWNQEETGLLNRLPFHLPEE